jgi:subfamily B ATP-binding cassette protein MsbA
MIVADIQKDIFSHFMMLDLKFFHTHPSGQLVSRVTSDVNVMRTAVSDSLTGVGSNLITLIFLVGVMIWQDWRLALVSFIVFPFASGLVMILGRRLRKISKSIQGETARLMGVLTQIFQGIRQVQAFGMEDAERKKASDAVWAVRSLNIKAVKVGSLSTPINEVLVGLVVFGIVVYGGYRIAAGHLTPGGLMSFIAAFALAYEPMKKLAKLNNTLQMGVGAAERVREMLDKIPGIVSDPGATQLAVKSPDVVFENVSFCYAAEEEARALDRLSFTAAGGKVTALVGASGSGKTTVFSLLLRFYDPQEGMVLIGGQDVRGVTVSSLRGSAALVSQDITIFDDTVAANIAYGCPGASEGKIREAARAAAAEEFILKLPEGYETQVGENGVRLSGGGSGNVFLWLGRYCAMRRSCCWTRRLRRWITNPNA